MGQWDIKKCKLLGLAGPGAQPETVGNCNFPMCDLGTAAARAPRSWSASERLSKIVASRMRPSKGVYDYLWDSNVLKTWEPLEGGTVEGGVRLFGRPSKPVYDYLGDRREPRDSFYLFRVLFLFSQNSRKKQAPKRTLKIKQSR